MWGGCQKITTVVHRNGFLELVAAAAAAGACQGLLLPLPLLLLSAAVLAMVSKKAWKLAALLLLFLIGCCWSAKLAAKSGIETIIIVFVRQLIPKEERYHHTRAERSRTVVVAVAVVFVC